MSEIDLERAEDAAADWRQAMTHEAAQRIVREAMEDCDEQD